ncbi:XAC2610-related protein [Sediminicola luteus]|uniref:Uncharacterized protein n=1 Tax=Sediminicola luteus TaxID=319238 RepID=A0A2A4G3G8_9FLAO|nr:hypothetical protein [Sediminicola luteus]PCE62528.1 hypothetical protein B7P33_17990 [Sediminicola luteus]
MKSFLFFLFLWVGCIVYGQTTYKIEGFSSQYRAELHIEKGYEDQVFKKGRLLVFDGQTQELLIELPSEEFTVHLKSTGTVKTNIIEWPYGEQSVLFYEDLNFDGRKDLALMDGQHSCYHGPSFQVYLVSDQGLRHNKAFSRLAQEYCGMFQIDHENKSIYTTTKNGCCWHQFSTFKVVDNTPVPVSVVEEDAMHFPFLTTTLTEWPNGKKQTSIYKTIDLQQEDVQSRLSFTLAKSGKELLLYTLEDEVLYYLLLQPNGAIEFAYPAAGSEAEIDFMWNTQGNSLGFTNQGAHYEIYETRKGYRLHKIGVRVRVNGKRYHLKGDVKTVKGSLEALRQLNLSNVGKE